MGLAHDLRGFSARAASRNGRSALRCIGCGAARCGVGGKRSGRRADRLARFKQVGELHPPDRGSLNSARGRGRDEAFPARRAVQSALLVGGANPPTPACSCKLPAFLPPSRRKAPLVGQAPPTRERDCLGGRVRQVITCLSHHRLTAGDKRSQWETAVLGRGTPQRDTLLKRSHSVREPVVVIVNRRQMLLHEVLYESTQRLPSSRCRSKRQQLRLAVCANQFARHPGPWACAARVERHCRRRVLFCPGYFIGRSRAPEISRSTADSS